MPTESPAATEAERLAAAAARLREAYDRRTWYRFALVFFPIPFVLVLLRLDLAAWHYYLFGAGYIGFSATLYTIDTRAAARCDAAEKAAASAAEQALRPPQP